MRTPVLLALGLCFALPAQAADQQLDTNALLERVQSLRELAPREPLIHEGISAAGVRRYVTDRFKESYTPQEMELEGKTLEKLGLVPAGTRYPKLLTDLLQNQIAGFYDPPTKKLYVANWIPMAAQAPTMVHEITHALQDQHFDLKSYIDPIKGNTDAQLARSALAEGDAMLVTLLDAGLELPDPPSQLAGRMMAFSDGPAYISETLSFPYLAGLDLVQKIKKGGGWKAVDRMYRRPPATTEQVLHPEKYQADERPEALDDWGAKALRRDVLGEFGLQRFLAPTVGEQEAKRAAAGWNGDQLWLLEGSLAVVHLSRWDQLPDAQEFQAAANRRLAKLAGQSVNHWARYQTNANTVYRVERRGSHVLCLIGVRPSEEQRIATRVWLHQVK